MANSAITFNTAGLATTTSPGLVSTGAQSFSGVKTFTSTPVLSMPYFYASRNATITRSASTTPSQALINFDTEAYDNTSNYASGVFTAPFAGIYSFSFCVVYYNGLVSTDNINIYLYKNTNTGTLMHRQVVSGSAGGTIVGTVDVLLAANDTISLYDAIDATSPHDVDIRTDAVEAKRTFFCGKLIART